MATMAPVVEAASPGAENILVTGLPRSGTTLTCHLLNKVPDTVALHEPMKVKYFADLHSPEERRGLIHRFFADQRESIRDRGVAISKQVDGAVPDNPYGAGRSDAGLRKSVASKGEVVVDKELSPGHALVVKHNSAFAALVGELVGHFPVYAVVRNPLSTIASWSSVEFNAQTGHVPAAERLDPGLRDALARLDDPLDRQLHVIAWFHGQYRGSLPEERILRYERIVESGGRALAVVRPGAEDLDEPLRSRNLSDQYDRGAIERIGERLLATDGPHWETYSRESVEELLEASLATS